MTSRLIIAAPRSGEGKTSVTLGLAHALGARSRAVALAKIGPDYLDTGWHALACGRPARNLDVWTMGEAGVRAAFATAARDADVVVVEGVMGLFDGHRAGSAPCSTADVARLLDAPVVLVIDASRAAASLAALAHGFATFDPRVRVAGVILNRFGEHRDRTAVAAAFERVGIPVLGWVPTLGDAVLPSRHLGLVQAAEAREAGAVAIERLGELMAEHVDLDAISSIAQGAGELPDAPATWAPFAHAGDPGADAPVVAVAADEAFGFTYADNLEALAALGARIVEFSPLHDAALPAGTSGIYLAGGYPELFASELSANSSLREAIAGAAAAGAPVFAECGGMLYLAESLQLADGRTVPMAGVLPARARMTERLQRLGYVEAKLAADGVLGKEGTAVRAHEFRYSTLEPLAGETPAWLVDGEPHGFAHGSVLASYLHLNFAGCPEVASAFVNACREHSASGATEDRSHI